MMRELRAQERVFPSNLFTFLCGEHGGLDPKPEKSLLLQRKKVSSEKYFSEEPLFPSAPGTRKKMRKKFSQSLSVQMTFETIPFVVVELFSEMQL